MKVGDQVRIKAGARLIGEHKVGDVGRIIGPDSGGWNVKARGQEGFYWNDELELVFATPDPEPFTQSVAKTYEEGQALLLKKHEDYGPKNIANSPGGPLMGLAVRLNDKLARMAHLLEKGVDPQNESLRDTLLDIMNYGAIGILVSDGNWPKGDS